MYFSKRDWNRLSVMVGAFLVRRDVVRAKPRRWRRVTRALIVMGSAGIAFIVMRGVVSLIPFVWEHDLVAVALFLSITVSLAEFGKHRQKKRDAFDMATYIRWLEEIRDLEFTEHDRALLLRIVQACDDLEMEKAERLIEEAAKAPGLSQLGFIRELHTFQGGGRPS